MLNNELCHFMLNFNSIEKVAARNIPHAVQVQTACAPFSQFSTSNRIIKLGNVYFLTYDNNMI